MSTEQDNAQKTARAMAAVDAMAATWAMTFDIRQAVNAMMRLPDGEDRLIAFIKQGYGEGLFVGRTSREPLTKTRIGNVLRKVKDGDVGMYRNGFKDGVAFAEDAHGIKVVKPEGAAS